MTWSLQSTLMDFSPTTTTKYWREMLSLLTNKLYVIIPGIQQLSRIAFSLPFINQGRSSGICNDP
jgi:hypothetical protein